MGIFSDLTARLGLDIKPFSDAMKRVREQTQRFSSNLAAITKDGSADRLIEGYTRLQDRLHKVGLGAKDIARIFSGIMISQTFYGITRSIREATDALWSFNESLDYANVTYGALFGSSDLAATFIDTLKQFSVDTIFEYSDIEGMARKLSAYGIEYQNLMYIIEGLTNIGTISGDTAALERLAVAIGQINAKGTLKAEEMRQLANAYTPIYDILRDKLGLSESDLGMVGDLGISSADAINAIIEYANETFGATADAAVQTITGLNNRIVDSLKVMGADIMSPLTTFYKSLASYIAGQLESIYDIYKTSGLGGVFEYLVPDEAWQQRIRSFVAAIKNAISTLSSLVITLGPYIKQFFGGMIDALTLFLGVLNSALSGLVGFLQSTAQNTQVLSWLTSALVAAAGGWLLFKLHAMGAAVISVLKVIIVDVAKAVVLLTTVLTKHPLIAGLLVFGAVLLGVASNAKNTDSALSKLVSSLNSFSIGGDTADDILQVGDAMDKGTNSADKFWNEMEDGAKDAEDSIEGAGNAAKKAAKSLLSFDEVFRLNEDESANAGIGSGALDGLKDLTDAFSGLGSALVPEIPDLSSFANDFVGSLYNSLWDSIKTIASGGATGALIGGLVGFAIGGITTGNMQAAIAAARLGANLGGIAGAAFAGFWTDTYKELEASLMKIAVGGSVGALAGGLAGLVLGAFISKGNLDVAITAAHFGAKLGTLAGLGIGAFWATATEEMNNAVEGLIVGGSAGAFAGSLIGMVIGAYIGEPGNRLKSALTGARLGSAIGGGLGAAIGGFWGGASEEFKAAIENAFSSIQAASYGSFIGGVAGMIIGAVVGAFAGGIGALPGAKIGATIGSAVGALGGLLVDYLDGSGIEESLGGWFGRLFSSISDFFTGIGTGITSAFNGIKNNISAFFKTIDGMVPDWLRTMVKAVIDYHTTIALAISDFLRAVFTELGAFFGTIFDSVASFFGKVATHIYDKFNAIGTVIKAYYTELVERCKSFFGEIYSVVYDRFDKLYTEYSNFKNKVSSAVTTAFTGIYNTVATWLTNIFNNVYLAHANAISFITGWFDKVMTNIANWFSKLLGNSAGWFKNILNNTSSELSKILSAVLTWFSNLENSIKTWFVGTSNKVKDWWAGVFDTSKWTSGFSMIKDWFNDLFTDIRNWFKDLGKSVGNWWDGLWDGKKASVNINTSGPGIGIGASMAGHAKGGIFSREHIARFAEGNKAEAVIPLEDNAAMQPFVNAISDGILQGLLPAMASGNGNSNNLPPMYVGTLIADERGLKQLYQKFELYEAKELARKGLL